MKYAPSGDAGGGAFNDQTHMVCARETDSWVGPKPSAEFSRLSAGKEIKIRFSRGHVHREKHFSARQCGIGSPFDPIMHAAGCNSSKKCWHF